MERKFIVSVVPGSVYPIWVTIQVNQTSIYLNMTQGDARNFASILSKSSAPDDVSFSSRYCLSETIGPTEQHGIYLVKWMSSDYVNIKNIVIGNNELRYGHNFLVEAIWAHNLSDSILAKLETLEPKCTCTCRCDCIDCKKKGFKCPCCGIGQMIVEIIANHHTMIGGVPVLVKDVRIAKCNYCGETAVHAKELEYWESIVTRTRQVEEG